MTDALSFFLAVYRHPLSVVRRPLGTIYQSPTKTRRVSCPNPSAQVSRYVRRVELAASPALGAAWVCQRSRETRRVSREKIGRERHSCLFGNHHTQHVRGTMDLDLLCLQNLTVNHHGQRGVCLDFQ